MITFKFTIKNYIDISEILYQFTGAVHYAYKQGETITVNDVRKKFGLDCHTARDAIAEAEKNRESVKSHKKEIVDKILAIEKALASDDFDKRDRYRLIKKLAYFNKSLSKDYVFGSKKKIKAITTALRLKRDAETIQGLKQEYKNSRTLPFYSSGDGAQKHGNVKFNLDIPNNRIYFKFIGKSMGVAIEIHPSKKQKKMLLKLQICPKIPVTYRLTNNYICITFDEEKLHGYSFDKKSWKNEIKLIPKEDKERRKEVHVKYRKEQNARRWAGKIESRYMGVDLNPQHIGWTILERDGTVIDKGYYDLTHLSISLEVPSSHPSQKRQNAKLKNEIALIWKQIFAYARHYKVAHFAVEDLNFKDEPVTRESREYNRKIKSIWLRGFTAELIKKYCAIQGIELLEVVSAYSSFIGNIRNNDYDPVNAATEICRRGVVKFEKGVFYPKLCRRDKRTMANLLKGKLGDLAYKAVYNLSDWKKAYLLFQKTGSLYRRSSNSEELSFESHKSEVFEWKFKRTCNSQNIVPEPVPLCLV